MNKYKWKNLDHSRKGGWTGSALPLCPNCGVAVLLFDDDIHLCKKEDVQQ